MVDKKQKQNILWGAIIVVALLDAFSSSLGTVPILGDIIAIGSNLVWEIIEIALVFGLINVSRKK